MPTNDQIILKQLLEDRKRDTAPELSESDYFELFCGEQVLKNYDASYDDIEGGLVGGGGDGGIDFMFVLINGEVIHEDTDLAIFKGDISIELHIGQAKRAVGFSEDAIHRLVASACDLFDLSKSQEDLTKKYNAKLFAIADKFRDACTRFAAKLPKLHVYYYYATLATEVHPNVKAQVANLKRTIDGLFSSADFTFDFLGATELLTLARTLSAVTYLLQLTEPPIAGDNSFICLVRLGEFYKFITDEQGRYRRAMFDANVRDYQGNVEVNQAIRQTLLHSEGEEFWWLNNGVTILATDATYTSRSLTIRNPQVVNGLQTSQEIFRAFQSGQVGNQEDSLLVRVINPQSEGSYHRIVRATNSQTTVPPASLMATDPIHRNIEDFLKTHSFYYERRKNYYKNEGRPRDKIIGISYLAQATMAIHLARPDDARARPSTLIKSGDDYLTVFNPQYPVQLYLVCTTLMKRVETFLRLRGLSREEVNNLKFYLAMFAARFALNTPKLSPTALANLAVDDLDDNFLETCFVDVHEAYENLGASDQVAKGPELTKTLSDSLTTLTHGARFRS